MDSDTGSINIIGRLNEMDIRWTSDGHPMFDTGERALQQDEPRAATIKVISATAKVRPCHVTCM